MCHTRAETNGIVIHKISFMTIAELFYSPLFSHFITTICGDIATREISKRKSLRINSLHLEYQNTMLATGAKTYYIQYSLLIQLCFFNVCSRLVLDCLVNLNAMSQYAIHRKS